MDLRRWWWALMVSALLLVPGELAAQGVPPPPRRVKGYTESLEDSAKVPAVEYAVSGSLRVWSWFAAGGGAEIDGAGNTLAARADLAGVGLEIGSYNPGGFFYMAVDFLSDSAYHATEVANVSVWVLYPTFGVDLVLGDGVTAVGLTATGTGARATYCTAVCLWAELRIPTFDLLANGESDNEDDLAMGVAWGTSARLGVFF